MIDSEPPARLPSAATPRSQDPPGAPILWVFLDVGNVLLDEDPLVYRNARIHWEAIRLARPDVSFLEFLALRERRVTEGSRWPIYDVVSGLLDDAGCAVAWKRAEESIRASYAELSPPLPGVSKLVKRLSQRYRLGIIANQEKECRAQLAALGLLGSFEIVALSEEQGVAKPDPALFRYALKRAAVPAECCMMVGDRLDNDVIPAGELGMKTTWVKWPRRSAKGWRPDDPEALACRDSLERTSLLAPDLWPQARPSLVIDEIRDLERVL